MNQTPEYIRKNRSRITALCPAKQSIPYKQDKWTGHPLFEQVLGKLPNPVSRGDLFEMSRALHQNTTPQALRELFVATMIWGFGTTGYGAWRTLRMVNDPDFDITLKVAYRHLCEGDIREAYDRFHLSRCGSAFFTKFLYFAAHPLPHTPTPLILDAVVARKLEESCHLDLSRYARAARYPETEKNKQSNRAGCVSSLGRHAMRYLA